MLSNKLKDAVADVAAIKQLLNSYVREWRAAWQGEDIMDDVEVIRSALSDASTRLDRAITEAETHE